MGMWKKYILSVIVILGFAFSFGLSGCATNPATGKSTLNLVGESREIEMGRQADKEITASIGLYPDEDLQTYIRDLGARLAAASERPKLPWTFRVVDDPAVNAFALPGGFVYVTRGILAYLNSEAELAGVIGHEIGHVTAQHAVQRISSQELMQVGLGVGMAIEPGLQQFGQVIGAGLGLLMLKFSREDENEADSLGVRYMGRVKYDSREMVRVMGMLDAVGKSGGGGRVPEWLSTHPDPGNRKEHIREIVSNSKVDFSQTVVYGDEYLGRIDGIAFGQNPREGYFQKNVFFHPELKFRYEFPGGWNSSNTKQAVLGVSKAQDALIQITLAQEATPDRAAQKFFAQEGVLMEDDPRAVKLHGFQAVRGVFLAQTEGGALKGVALFVLYGKNVYQILGYSTAPAWPSYQSAIERSTQSFDEVTDPKVLSVQPMRLQVVTLDAEMDLKEFARRYPSPVSLDTLALINQVGKDARLGAGLKMKRVTGEKTP
jgi:predicted Zn-dependent protease